MGQTLLMLWCTIAHSHKYETQGFNAPSFIDISSEAEMKRFVNIDHMKSCINNAYYLQQRD